MSGLGLAAVNDCHPIKDDRADSRALADSGGSQEHVLCVLLKRKLLPLLRQNVLFRERVCVKKGGEVRERGGERQKDYATERVRE